MARQRSRGFTLIELLVVIAIIAVLAAILFPVFARAKQRAQQIACLSNVKQLGLAIIQYASDWDGRFPYCGGTKSSDLNLWQASWVKTYSAFDIHVDEGSIWRYVMDQKVYTCPLDIRRRRSDGTLFPLSYMMSDAVSCYSQDAVKSPSLVILLLEEDDKSYNGNGANDGRFVPGGSNATDKVAGSLSERHMRGGNYFYVDGHAGYHRPEGIQDRTADQLPWGPRANP
jgi:prepilin-type N-terminal cleavage/methylation domain-containing protein/prepilin-type processing-associated H-X9-DG protein